MGKIDLKIDTIKQITKEEINILQQYMTQTIPLKSVVLIEKFQILVKYNLYLINKKNDIELNKYIQKIEKIDLSISASDISRIKKYIEQINLKQHIQNKFILQTNGHFVIDKKLSLSDVHKYYIEPLKRGNTSNIIKASDIEFYSSIKIFDFYKNSDDKKEFFARKDVQQALSCMKNIKKIQILSIIDTPDMHNMLSYLSSYHKDIVEIKHISESESSYIPSLFFVLIKFKLKNSNNYKEYIFYLEEKVNFGVASYVSQTSFSKHFFRLLEERFDTQFLNPNNINFNIKNEQDNFEYSLTNILESINSFLIQDCKDIKSYIQELKNQIVSLKLHYPKMKYNYELLIKIVDYVSVIKKISIATNNKEPLYNTMLVIKEISKKRINANLDKLLDEIQNTQLYIDKNIDIFKLRKSIFVNTISNSNMALCDIFNELEWKDKTSILLSLKTIETNQEKLNKLFSYFGNIHKTLTYQELQSLFQNKIINQILNGESISLITKNE